MIKITTKLQTYGNNQALLLPSEILNAAHVNKNDELDLLVSDEGIQIKKADNIKTLNDIFEGYESDYHPDEINTGKPVGHEVW